MRADFGVAVAFKGEAVPGLRVANEIVGTQSFCPPTPPVMVFVDSNTRAYAYGHARAVRTVGGS